MMNKIILLMLFLAVSCAAPQNIDYDKPVTIIYDIEIQDVLKIKHKDNDDIAVNGYHASLTNKLTSAFRNNYRNVVYAKDVPNEGTSIIIYVIRPSLITQGQTAGLRIWYIYSIFINKKKVKEVNDHFDTVIKNAAGEHEINALIASAHQKMINNIASETLKAEKKTTVKS